MDNARKQVLREQILSVLRDCTDPDGATLEFLLDNMSRKFNVHDNVNTNVKGVMWLLIDEGFIELTDRRKLLARTPPKDWIPPSEIWPVTV